MAGGSWVVRRARSRAAVVVGLGLLSLLMGAALISVVGQSERAATQSVRDYVATAPATEQALQLRTRYDDAAQVEEVRSCVDRALAGLPVQVALSLATDPRAVVGAEPAEPGGAEPTLRVASYAAARDRVRLSGGDWPQRSTEGLLAEAAATELGVRVGDTVALEGGTAYAVSGLWRPRDPAATELVDDAVAEGAPALGTLLVTPAAVVSERPDVRLTTTVDLDRVRVEEVAPLVTALDRVGAVDARVPALEDPSTGSSGGLVGSLRTVATAEASAAAVRPIPLLVVVAVALVMVSQPAVLLARRRRPETALLRLRGASGRQLLGPAAVEAAVVVGVPGLLGALGAAAGVWTLGGRVPLTGWLLVLGMLLLLAATVAVPGSLPPRSPRHDRADDAGRRRRLAASTTVVALAVTASALAAWRLLTAPAGDPVALLAPALLLLAGALLAVLLFAGLATALEAGASRLRGLDPVLSVRTVARLAATYGVAVLVLAVAVGVSVLAAGFASTQATVQSRIDALNGGAALQAALPEVDPMIPTSYDDSLPRLRETDGVAEALHVHDRAVTLGTTDARLLGVTSAALPRVLPEEIADVAQVLRGTEQPAEEPRGGWALPAGTTAISLDLALSAEAEPGSSGQSATGLRLSLWLQAADGSLQLLELGSAQVPLDGRSRASSYVVRTPALPAGSSVVGLDTSRLPESATVELALRVTDVTATTAAGSTSLLDAQPWELAAEPETSGESLLVDRFTALADGVGWEGISVSRATTRLRLVPASSTGPLPVVVEQRLARALDLEIGDRVDVALSPARQLPAAVVGLARELPGEQAVAAVATDLARLSAALLDASQAVPDTNRTWATGAAQDGAVPAAALEQLPASARLVAVERQSASGVPATTALALWLGAVAALALSVVGVGFVVALARETRREELVALRAVGLGVRRLARTRTLELVAVLVTGLLLGAVLGAVVASLAVRRLVDAALLGGSPLTAVRPTVEALPLLLAGGSLVLALTVVVVQQHARTRRDAQGATPTGARP